MELMIEANFPIFTRKPIMKPGVPVIKRMVKPIVAVVISLWFTSIVAAGESKAMVARIIDEGLFVEVNGLEQWVVMRGTAAENPALLIISGPGVALSPIAPFFEAWEQHFTLVFWDQPWSGATHALNPDGQGTLAIDRLVADGIAVAGFAKARLNKKKILVLGISAGSIIGLEMMQQQPEYFLAYVGTGQFIDWATQDALGYALLLEKAKREANAAAEQELLEIGKPPYADAATDAIKSNYHSALTEAEMREFPVFSNLMVEALSNPSADANYLAQGLPLSNPRELAMQAYVALREELVSFNAYELEADFAMPVLFLQGAEDYYSVTSEVQKYTSEINAPMKNTVVIEGGSHSVFWLRERFLAELNQHLGPLLID